MELGEGLCKLRKMNFRDGPLHDFEKEISAALDFIYQTQLELAACKFLIWVDFQFLDCSYCTIYDMNILADSFWNFISFIKLDHLDCNFSYRDVLFPNLSFFFSIARSKIHCKL